MKRGITIILAAVMALGLGLGGLSVAKNAQGTKEFISDGYILDPSDEEYVTDNVDTQYYFSAGAKYKEKYGSQIVFKSSTGDNQTIDSQHFIHYNDGSLGAFTKGVLMDVSEINDSNYGYYSLTQNTVLIKNGNSYEMTSRGEAMNITEFIWKISDTDYMLVSPNITLNIGGNDVNFSDYVQLTYVDNGIVRLTHQSGTYQTVAADSKLTTQNGTELNLVGKEFIVDGEPVFSLDDMAIDDDSYIDVDENITDQPTIPTFNVINGKDGANGTDGTDGEQGIEGEEGAEGEQGSEGDEGAEGTSGTAGGSGGDGVEGDTGIMGYDGAEGIDGKDAETAASASTIVSADLKARPTITVDAGDASTAAGAYNVKSGSAEMLVNLDDSDNSLIPGTATVRLFDKKTMKEVTASYGSATAESMGSALESGTANLNFTDLTADTEYVLMVEGDYEVDDQGTMQHGILFQKVFKTEPVGIAIAKDHVTDTEIAAITRVTGSVDSYSVRFYYYDENNTRQDIATFDGTNTGATFMMNDTAPAPGNNGRDPGFTDVKSNTKYYAELANVTSGGQLVKTDGSEVELTTLKQYPYDAVQYKTAGNPIVYVSEMKPNLVANNKNHSYTVDMNALADIDQGITGYRVELYKSADISAATSLNDVTPTYVKEMNEYTGTTFSIPNEDNAAYRARVVVLFNDNEKDAELTTLFSDQASLSTTGGTLSVEFIAQSDATKKYDPTADGIKGYIKIIDNDNSDLSTTQVLRFIDGTNPLVIEISGEYHDVYTIEITNKDDPIINKSNTTYWLIPYEQIGLHKNSTYTIRVLGPQDTDGSHTIEGAEKKSYLAGLRAVTGDYKPLVLLSKKRPATSAAFNYGVYVAPSVASTSGNTEELNGANYSISTLETVELQLFHFDGVKEVQLGGSAKLVDTQSTLERTSDFQTYQKNFEDGEENPDTTLGSDGTRGLLLKDSVTNDITSYNVIPESFGIDNMDSRLFSGGIFKIKVVSASDYTGTETGQYFDGKTGNDIPFVEGKDLIAFSVEKTHVRSDRPNDSITVTPLTNSAAANGYEEPGVSADTVVGLRFSANYSYADVKKVEYNIYEVVSDLDEFVPAAGGVPAVDGTFIDATGKLLNKDSNDNFALADPAVVKLNLVLTGTHENAGNERSVGETELYFKGTLSTSDYSIDWKKADTTSATGEDVIKRGKRYVISYRVFTDYSITNHGTSGDHWYPDCVYAGTALPLYRSSVIELEKQMPAVERYPVSSSDTAEVWNYRIIDPDNAIIVDGSGDATLYIKKDTAFANFANATTTVISDITGFAALTTKLHEATYTTDFAAYTVASLEDNKYYRVAIPFKTLESATGNSYIASKPLLHKKLQTVSDTNIYLRGAVSTQNDYVGDLVSGGTLGTGRLKSILNEGNYRYKLTFNGSDLDKFAAFRIAVTDKTNTSKGTVIYDPVYIAFRDLDGTTPYGFAYIDQAPLAAMAGDEVEFFITGYYSRNDFGFSEYVSGRGEFTSVFDDFNGKSFYLGSSDSQKESVYAFKNINGTDGTSNYRTRNASGWGVTKESGASVLGSIFVPGNSKGLGLTKTVVPAQKSTASFSARFFASPIETGTGTDTQPDQIGVGGLSFDETGLHSGDNYYTVDKLAYKEDGINIYTSESNQEKTYSFTQNTVTAAVKANKISPGAMTATLDMSLVGATTTQIYAKVYNKTGGSNTLMYLEKKTEGTPGSEITYYNVVAAPNPGNGVYDYGTNEFKNNTYISAQDGKVFLRLRNLTPTTDYGVLFYVYAADGTTEVPLFSIDAGKANVMYSITTKADIKINIYQPEFTYSAYDDKYASISFNVDGDDGSGIRLKYAIVPGSDPNNSNNVASGLIMPIGTSTYKYYHSNPALNNAVKAYFNPSANGGSPLALGGVYTIKIIADAYDWSLYPDGDGPSGGSRGTSYTTFTMPNRLDAPSFYTELTASGTDLRVSIQPTDEMKSIMNSYTVRLYDMTLIDENEDEITAQAGLMTGLTNGGEEEVYPDFVHRDVVTFSNVPIGTYIVRIVAKADLNNNGSFNNTAPENDVYIVTNTLSSAGVSATAEPGASATTDVLTIDLRNLSNFDDVTNVFYTVFDISTGSEILTATAPVTDVDKTNNHVQITKDWSSSNIVAGNAYRIQMQLRSSTDRVLGQVNVSVTPTAVTP